MRLTIKNNCDMKSKLKVELARAAGVSPRTFCRWLSRHKEELERMGVSPKAHIVPPIAVKYICEEYGIDPEEL